MARKNKEKAETIVAISIILSVMIIIGLLAPLVKVHYISFDFFGNEISRYQVKSINKPILTNFLENLLEEEIIGDYTGILYIIDLKNCDEDYSPGEEKFKENCSVLYEEDFDFLVESTTNYKVDIKLEKGTNYEFRLFIDEPPLNFEQSREVET